jgi:UTP--glucose-1-phosphate uridylyltransferase
VSEPAASADFTPHERALLEGLHFRFAEFETLQEALRANALPDNAVTHKLEVPPPGTIAEIPSGDAGDLLARQGQDQLDHGAAALVLLNGGMATRFGGRVKGAVDALPGHSFLSLQMRRLQALAADGAACPLLLMNSEATDRATREHLEGNDYFGLARDDAFLFTQSGAPRLRADGSLYRDASGALSIYGPGHGDLLPSLRRSGALHWARERGVTHLLVANVDNLGAALDPSLLGMFTGSGREMMVEVCDKRSDDVGGCPASVGGRVQIVEGFAFPKGFDQQSLPVFNTNTLWFRTDALERELPLRWYPVRKKVDGADVVQFEQLVGQASWFLDSLFTRVPRERFAPVKSPEDLAGIQGALREMFPGAR